MTERVRPMVCGPNCEWPECTCGKPTIAPAAYAEGRKDEREEWERRTEHLFVQRENLQEQNQRLLDVLCGIHSLLPSLPIETSDGKTYVFQDPNANETLRALRIKIAGIMEAVAAIRNAQFAARASVK